MKCTREVLILSGAILLGSAVHAQSTNPDPAGTDTTRRYGMHHNHGPRNSNDSVSMHRRQDWRARGAEAGRPGMAQEGRHGFAGKGREGRMRIHFTPEQRQQMMAINKDYHKRSEDLFKKDNITLKEYKASLIALQKEKKSKLEALLTPQQKEELAKRKTPASENAQVMAAAHLERLKLRLNLSDEQVAKVRAGQASLKAQAQSIHNNENLLPQQKREQLKDLMSKREETIKSVLTPEQLSRFEEMHKGRGRHAGGPGGFRPREEEGK